MYRLSATVLTASLVVLAVSPAFAQPAPGGFRAASAPGPALLLLNDKVQEDLKLTDDQKADLQKARDKVFDAYKDDFARAWADLKLKQMSELGKAQGEDLDKAATGVLRPEQARRLKQIEVQAAGLDAFARDDVRAALKLTDAQTKALKETTTDLQEDIQELLKDAQGDQTKVAGAFKKVQAWRAEALDKAVAELTGDQKRAWKDLTGDRIDAGFGPPLGFAGGFGPAPRPGMTRGPSAATLARNERVQAELKLTEDQKADLKKASDKVYDKYKGAFDKARADLDFKKMGDLFRARGADLEKATFGALKAEQGKRLRQIEVQAAGLDAFARQDVRDRLGLNDAQTKDAVTAIDNLQENIQLLVKDAQGDLDKLAEAFRKGRSAHAEAFNRVMESLTDDQKETWKVIVGDKFEIGFVPPWRPR